MTEFHSSNDSRSAPAVKTRRSAAKFVFVVALSCYATLQIWFLVMSNASPAINDFWGLWRISERLTNNNLGALHNGFYGYFYPLVLHAIPQQVLLPVSGILSVSAAVLVIAFTYCATTRITGSAWALVAAAVVALQPSFFFCGSAAGADSLAALPVAVAIWALVRFASWSGDQDSSKVLFWCGLLISIGGSTRYHVLLLAVIPMAFGALSRYRPFRQVIAALAGSIVGYLPQIVVNSLAGQLPLSTTQGFNVYRQVSDVQWMALSQLDPLEYTSVLNVIAVHPHEFISAYLRALVSLAFAVSLPLLAALVSRFTPYRRVMWSLCVGTVFFVIVVSIAYSERAVVPIVSIVAVATGVLFRRMAQGIHRRCAGMDVTFGIRLCALLVSLVVFAWWVIESGIRDLDSQFTRVSAEQARTQNETLLLGVAPEISRADQVFSNDFDFYLRSVPGFLPMKNGGWLQLESDPALRPVELDLTSSHAFMCAVIEHDIRAVLWNPAFSTADSDLSDLLEGRGKGVASFNQGTAGRQITVFRLLQNPCSSVS